MRPVQTIIIILGDQLSPNIGSLRGADAVTSIILMAEVAAEATYVRHHKKKIAFLFSAMRHFAEELRTAGWRVHYTRLDDPDNSGSITGEALRIAAQCGAAHIRITEPAEWRLREEILALGLALNLDMLPDDRFIASYAEFENWAKGRKSLRMEYFYREIRRKTGLLMAKDEKGDQPEGGQWNYDHDNRKPTSRDLLMPRPLRFG